MTTNLAQLESDVVVSFLHPLAAQEKILFVLGTCFNLFACVRAISQQEYWIGLPFPIPGIFPTQGSNLCLWHLLHWQEGSLPLNHLGSPRETCMML